jgi:2-(1,2-epoxy-1,2-dihydrophenyl)acetyl-CoA isomerase
VRYEDIELIKDEGIAFIYLNRPKVLNALSETMMLELVRALKEAEEDPDIRVLILTGRGSGFCAGADLNRFLRAQGKSDNPGKKAGFGLLDLPRAFVQYPKPIIAAINGPSYGFGFTVTLTCDIRLASERATFSAAFVRIGLTPEFCSTYFLPRLIGYGNAAELIFTARPFDAREALEMGAVNRVFPHNRLMPETKKMAQQIASMPPTAVQRSKEILRHGMQSTLDQVIRYEATTFLDSMKTEEHRSALNKLLAQMKFRNAKTRASRKV